MKKQLLLIILGSLFLCACTPATTSTPTLEPLHDGWSTFYSPEFGFSFQYPAVFDKGFQSLEFTCNFSVGKRDKDNLDVSIGDILIIAEKTNKNLAEYTSYYIESRIPSWEVKQTKIEIDRLSANSLEYSRENPSRFGATTIVVKENNAIIVQYTETNFFFCDLKDDNYSSYWVYGRIIESLRFQQ